MIKRITGQIVLFLLLVTSCYATRVMPAFEQFFDGDGNVLSGGTVHFTVTGTNATDKDTYSDLAETVPNTNPVTLDSEGRITDVFGTGSYRVTVYDYSGIQISQKDPVPGDASTSGIPNWNTVTTFSVPDLVVADDYNLYRSLVNDNVGDDPRTSPSSWEQVFLGQFYNPNKTYIENEICLDTSGIEYRSLVASNLGNSPSSSPTEWFSLETSVETNTAGIATNVTGIATNVTNIATNVTNIATNVTDIATNVTGIATNVIDITAVDTKYDLSSVDLLLRNVDTASPGTANIGRGYQSSQYYGADAIGAMYIGSNSTGVVSVASGNSGGLYFGSSATGVISIGSTTGTAATKKLISGAKEATFEEIIDVSSAAMLKAQNLNDVDDKATSRTNLDVYSKTEVDTFISDLSGSYTDATLGADWSIVAGRTLKYRKVMGDNFVSIVGELSRSADTSDIIFTLPVGYRPIYTTAILCDVQSDTVFSRVIISDAGIVSSSLGTSQVININILVPIL